MKQRKMEIPEIQIIQKMMLKNKISHQLVATNNGIGVSKLKALLAGKAITTQEKIDNIMRYVVRYTQ